MLRKLINQNRKRRRKLQKKKQQSQHQLLLQLLPNGLHQSLNLYFMISKLSYATPRILKLPCKNFIPLRCGMIRVFQSGYSNMKNSTRRKELRSIFATICSMVSSKESTTKSDQTL
jgi:hypothetical protein